MTKPKALYFETMRFSPENLAYLEENFQVFSLKEPSDALKMFELAKALSVESEDMKEEIEDMDVIKVGFVVNDKDYQFNVTIGEGKIDVAEGPASDPSVTLSTTMENWGGMLSGELDATSLYMGGDLAIDGNLQDAIAFEGTC